MLTYIGSYILNIETVHIVTCLPEMYLQPRFSAAGVLYGSSQKASAATSKLALHGR
jgi:hypothetical protein